MLTIGVILLVAVGLIGVTIAIAGRRKERYWEDDEGNDPYAAFDDWMRKNGFADVAGCSVEETDLERLEQAVWEYLCSGASCKN